MLEVVGLATADHDPACLWLVPLKVRSLPAVTLHAAISAALTCWILGVHSPLPYWLMC